MIRVTRNAVLAGLLLDAGAAALLVVLLARVANRVTRHVGGQR